MLNNLDNLLQNFINSDGDTDVEGMYAVYQNEFNKKNFLPGEQKSRMLIFNETLTMIIKHNSKTAGYKMGLNKFSDISFDEFKSTLLSPNLTQTIIKNQASISKQKNKIFYNNKDQIKNFTSQMDKLQTLLKKKRRLQYQESHQDVSWSQYAGRVKDQISCSACYAFSGLAALEMFMAINNNEHVDLSEQSMIDCISANNGCKSGSISTMFDFINRNTVADSMMYPYEGVTNYCNEYALEQSHGIIPKIRYSYLQQYVASVLDALRNGPVIIVQTVSKRLKQYSGGIFDDPHCNDALDHSTLAIGFNLSSGEGQQYLLVKNSWGADWGEGGYFRLKIDSNNLYSSGVCNFAGHPYNMQLTN